MEDQKDDVFQDDYTVKIKILKTVLQQLFGKDYDTDIKPHLSSSENGDTPIKFRFQQRTLSGL